VSEASVPAEETAVVEVDATTTRIIDELRVRLGDDLVEVGANASNPVFRVKAHRRPEALLVLKTLGYTYYAFAGGVDYPDDNRFDVIDHVENFADGRQVTVKCDVPRTDPRVPTATTVFRGADWHEREAWELFGIVFTGHPKLRRLLLADWQEGFPMRKDEVLRPRIEKPWPGDFFSG
jgi:NADH-quinone oxidoreductase subunit C